VSAANEWDIECEHEKINSISPTVHVLFCSLYKNTNNNVFDDFPKISKQFPKISEDFPKLFRRLGERLRTFSENFPKIAEDCRRLMKVAENFRVGTDDVSIIQHHLWVLFKRLCSYSNGNLKTCDNNLIFSHVKISYCPTKCPTKVLTHRRCSITTVSNSFRFWSVSPLNRRGRHTLHLCWYKSGGTVPNRRTKTPSLVNFPRKQSKFDYIKVSILVMSSTSKTYQLPKQPCN